MNNDIDIKKRGRPRGEEKVGFYRRLTPLQAEKVAEYVHEVVMGRREPGRPAFDEASRKVVEDNEVLLLRLALSERDDRIKELEGEVDKLRKSIEGMAENNKWGA